MSMSRYTYNGDQKVVFSHYLDVTDPDKPVTLVAEPGKTYDIKQAEGWQVIQPDGQFTDQDLPMPPDDNWGEAEGDKPEAPKAAAKKKETGTDA
jgi:hypothetical protein